MVNTGENKYSEPKTIFEKLETDRQWVNDLSSKARVENQSKFDVNIEIQRELIAEENLDNCELTRTDYGKQVGKRLAFENRYTNQPEGFEDSSIQFIENEVEPLRCEECLGEGKIQCSECGGDTENRCGNCNSSGEIICGCSSGTKQCTSCGGSEVIDCTKCKRGRVDCDNCDDGRVNCECTIHGERGKRTTVTKKRRTVEKKRDVRGRSMKDGSHEEEITNQETTTCGTCNGSGEKNCEICRGKGDNECSSCDGSGSSPCNNCENGRIVCKDCGGNPISRCKECLGEGTIPCDSCDGRGNDPCEVCDQTGELFYAKIGEIEYRSETCKEVADAEKIRERVGRKGLEKVRNSEGHLQDRKTEEPDNSPDPEKEVVIRTEMEARTVPVQEIEYRYEDSKYTLYEIDSEIHYENNNHPLSEIAKSEQKALGAIFLLGVLILIGFLLYFFLYVPLT
ncbi:hypothetical protein [Natronorubrum sp. DTA7]|uniref:hypothetical protein n=1 Tax=Natronorubrum sp. DTA7 TaxID=3447016 RepID=UPI003F8793F8